jgi:antitoxin FitA
MATLTVEDFPDALYAALKNSADRHGRSINEEAIAQLDVMLRVRDPAEKKRMLTQMRAFRKRLEGKIWLTEEDVDRFINEGRE